MPHFADASETFKIELRKLGLDAARLHPDISVRFARVVTERARGQFRCAGAFAVALTVERPGVVLTPETFADDDAGTELASPVRTEIFEGANRPRFGAKQDEIPAAQCNRHRLALEFPPGQHGMPMIEYRHCYSGRSSSVDTSTGQRPGLSVS
jgi:hypothetical protein